MTKIKRIVFMGTPDFAVPTLKKLHESTFDVVAVVTAPDKPSGRGQRIHTSAVKQYAEQNNIPVLQPTNLKSEDFQKTLRSYHADIQVVVAFRMLPEAVWDMPPMGSINLHASLLPNYRGAAPINWVLINGETETGLTTFFIQHDIDTGNILFQEKTAIHDTMNAGELHDLLMEKGAQLVLKTIESIHHGHYDEKPQQVLETHQTAPKIYKKDCEIDWSLSIHSIHNHIRGLSPFPGAYTYVKESLLKIYSAKKHVTTHSHQPGTLHYNKSKNKISVYLKDGILELLEIQPQGKKKMDAIAYLNGYKGEEFVYLLNL